MVKHVGDYVDTDDTDDEDDDTEETDTGNIEEPTGNKEDWIATGMYVVTDATRGDNNVTLYAVMMNTTIVSTGKYLQDRKLVQTEMLALYGKRKWVSFDFHKLSDGKDSETHRKLWVSNGFNIKHSVGKIR